MFCEKVTELLKEAERNRDTIDQYNLIDKLTLTGKQTVHLMVYAAGLKHLLYQMYHLCIAGHKQTKVNKEVGILALGDSVSRAHGRGYWDEKIRQIVEEMHLLFKMNMNDANATTENKSLWTTVQVRHSALERNKRCLLAYLYDRMNKIRTLRWEFGSVLPPDVRELLSDQEYEWFSKYSTNLATYMRSLGKDIGYSGIDLTENLRPPKSLYIEVLCVADHGKLELEDGDVIMLKKNSRHFLPTSECQTLILRGVLKQIS